MDLERNVMMELDLGTMVIEEIYHDLSLKNVNIFFFLEFFLFVSQILCLCDTPIKASLGVDIKNYLYMHTSNTRLFFT